MMGLLQDIPYYWTEYLDPRVADLPLLNSSYQVPLIICAYLYFVLGCGPRFMKNRPPYSLKTFIQFYNIVQILANGWLTYEHINAGFFPVKLACFVADYSYDYTPMRLVRCIWYYFLLKILDYIDTVIFVLRKKNNQISTLHLYHHTSTLLLTWIGARYYAVDATAFITITNSFIHAIMYTYYFLTTLESNVQKTVASMKRWITIIQMVQFVVIIIYGLQLLVCKTINKWVVIVYIGNVIMVFYLFYNFYKRAYTHKEPKKIQ